MKKDAILFVDIDDSSVPLYSYREPHFIAAKEMGLNCLVAAVHDHKGMNRLHADADEIFLLDKISEENILNIISSVEHYHIKAVFCHAGHASLQGHAGCIVANVCQKLNLPYSSAEAIAACNNKFLMRHQLKEHEIRSVDFALCNDMNSLEEQALRLGFPLIFKPPFGASSAFIKKCHTMEELLIHYNIFINSNHNTKMSAFYSEEHDIVYQNKIIEHYLPGQSVLLEQYAEGIEGTVECVVHQGTVYPLLINEKLLLTEMSGTLLENLLITPPVSFSKSEIVDIKQYAIDCISALGIKNDIVHLEFKINKNGPVIIEVNPRLGGLYVDLAFRDVADINPYKSYLSMLLQQEGIEKTLQKGMLHAENNIQHFAMMAIYPEKSGFFNGFENIDYIKNHPQCVAYGIHPCGTYINADVEENYLLKCWLKVNDQEHAWQIYQSILSNVTPIISAEITTQVEYS
jgi:predicted ATP-grasp superfamily ATP-dependent carboligase